MVVHSAPHQFPCHSLRRGHMRASVSSSPCSEEPAPSEFHSLRFISQRASRVASSLAGRLKFCPYLKASAVCRGRHNRISVFVWDSRLSDSSPHSQPLLYLGGCYREGRWLITINRTERESEWASEWVRGPCTSTNRTTPPRTKELGGRC